MWWGSRHLGSTPGGPTNSIQYNTGSALGGLSSFYLNPVNGEVTVIDTSSIPTNLAGFTVKGNTQYDDIQAWYTGAGVIGTGPDACYVQYDGTFVAITGIRIIGTLIDGTDTVGVSGQILSTTGTGTRWVDAGSGFTNPMTTLGDTIYEDATPTAVRLAGNTTTIKQYLSQTGDGVNSAAPAWAQIAAADLSDGTTGTGAIVLASAISGFGSGTVTSFSAGALSPLFTTSVATSTTTPALSFSLSNAAQNAFLAGPTVGGAGAPAYRAIVAGDVPTLPYIATSLMTTLGDIIYEDATPAAARLAGNTTATKMYLSQTGNGSISAVPAWAQINYADITGTTPTPPSGAVLWSALGNAGGNLSLANGTNTTTFNQTTNAIWLWANTTTGTSGTTNASPLIELGAQYYTGSTTGNDVWSIGSSLAAGTNGASTLTIAHSGSTGLAEITTAAVLNLTQTPSQTQATLVLNGDVSSGWHQANAQASNWTYMYGGYNTFTVYGNFVRVSANGGYNFTASATNAATGGSNATADSGISRLGAASLAIGNGAASDTTGNLSFGKVIKYNGIATISGGVPSELAVSDLTAQTAAITATTLYATTATGMYRVSWSADITTASDGSSVLGGTNGFQVLYTSPTDSVVKTTVAGNSVTSAANTTGTALGGSLVVYAKTGTNIQFTYGYTSVQTTTAMAYELHIKVEAL